MRRGCRDLAVVVTLALAGSALGANVMGTVKVPKGRAPEDAVVFVAPVPGKAFPAPADPVVMDQIRKKFTPHVLLVRKGQRVLFPNSDLVRHNVFSPSTVHRFNLGIYPPGASKEEVFDASGVVALLCALHPEMSAYIVVTETPWAAHVGADGRYSLSGLPPGRYDLVAWHEGLKEARVSVQLKTDDVVQDIVMHRGE
jgi:plastocyanin